MPREIRIGDRVRSYDFPERRDCYIEGTVLGFRDIKALGCTRYDIAVTRQVVEDADVDVGTGLHIYPPVNGTPTSLGGVCNGVELILASALDAALGSEEEMENDGIGQLPPITALRPHKPGDTKQRRRVVQLLDTLQAGIESAEREVSHLHPLDVAQDADALVQLTATLAGLVGVTTQLQKEAQEARKAHSKALDA